uniref:Flap endonuclease 1 n=1 Tax=Myxobolus squamalis TaxID=59785 RepID=A0A6B2G454_MYXSQ
MGIKGLSKFISKKAPSAVKEVEIGTYFGRVIAIDASVIIYQFLTSARDHSTGLLNSIGEDTSHLSGVLYRSLRMLENGIKPIFVFDGKPPKEKEEELKKRADNREKVKVELDKAMSNGDTKLVESLSKRIVKISDSHIDSCKKLLDLMGIPFINAINDAEAQCALLVKSGHAFAVATEDMDALAFGAKYLIRKFSHPKDKSNQMKQYDLEEICNKLNIDNDQFVDLCILMGCDFCDTIKGLGPFNAYKYIQKYKSIDSIITNIDSKKFIIPDHFDFKNARNLFINPSNSMESLKIAVFYKPH